MLRKAFLLKLFDAFSILRWNDQIRPMELVEMDKHAHKMAIAYCLARYEEDKTKKKIKWTDMIKGGIFELLRRIVVSDIKAPVYSKIRENKKVFDGLNEWIFKQLSPLIDNTTFKEDIRSYLIEGENHILDEVSCEILKASHIYASQWEFNLIKRISPFDKQISKINTEIEEKRKSIDSKKITTFKEFYHDPGVEIFINLVGQLRFQKRWSQTPRIPRTSVLGHSMMVATIAYLLSFLMLEEPCEVRLRNNFFAGLFHDLPESVTRDIISPLKHGVVGLEEAIKKIESKYVREKIHPFIEKGWIDEINYFIFDEFESKIMNNGEIITTTTEVINKDYNKDEHNPIDGEIIKIADELATFMEAYKAIKTGIDTPQLRKGFGLKDENEKKKKAGIKVGKLYADF